METPKNKNWLVNKKNDKLEARNIENKEINNKHDKTFKIILENKEEVAKLINKTIDFGEVIKPEDLEKYNRSFVTKNYRIQ